LRLNPQVLADIFLGKITKWDAPAITGLNRGVRLPNASITVVHRADGSGTTWIFTNYLARVSPEWTKRVGAGKSVSWPAGVGGKGNEGVAAYVQRVNGAIGYVEYAYALQNRMTTLSLRNRAGAFVSPSIRSFAAAAASANWKKAPGFYMVLTDQPGKDTWPISGASFILVHKDHRDPARAVAMLKFFDWCYRHGADMAAKLDYVPIPNTVYELVEKTWKSEIKAKGKPIWR
jgi:phosphate transport system substrate-binding protein